MPVCFAVLDPDVVLVVLVPLAAEFVGAVLVAMGELANIHLRMFLYMTSIPAVSSCLLKSPSIPSMPRTALSALPSSRSAPDHAVERVKNPAIAARTWKGLISAFSRPVGSMRVEVEDPQR